jgi:tRNA nucleotidyltransferase (CCA-adding enzyme)
MDVDFCNLRNEAYAEDSRIPTSAMGTPLEDSYRRDFTMNALYYNLHSNVVEDWTNRGLLDLLDTKEVRTPLEAYQTFHDDPLRVLRAIRFAVRYEMALSDELQQAAVHPQIHNELHRKVSRERVGKELEGMLSGKHANPIQALKLICNLKLAGSVFCFPSSNDGILGTIGQTQLEPVPYRATTANDDDELGHLRQVGWEEARECLRVLPKVIESVKLQDGNTTTSWDKRMLYLGVVFLPYEHLQYVGKNNKVKYVAESMMREGIKFKNTDVAAMITIVEQLNRMSLLLQRTPDATSTTRLQAGLLLRATKNMWVTTLMVATVALLRKKQTTSNTQATSDTTTTMDWNKRAQEWYHTIVVDLELDECWKVKPLMNGKDIIQLLGLCKGPLVGIYTQEQIQWMLMHPKGTVEDCKTFLKSCYKQRELESDQAAQHISKKMHL